MESKSLPVVVIGAGPIGLAAAVHLIARGETPLVLEAGPSVATSVRKWGHVRLFSPWEFNIDPLAAALLTAAGWVAPDPHAYPTGAALIEQYLAPLAAHPAIAPHLRFGSQVRTITRQGLDKLKTAGRDSAPFVVFVEDADGNESAIIAKAVIDASGTYATPNPLGAHGTPALGERGLASAITYGLADVLGAERAHYAGKRIAVVGSGHSAFNVLQDLVALAESAPGTSITWIVRRTKMDGAAYGGGAKDQLAARGALGQVIQQLVETNKVNLITGFKIDRLTPANQQVLIHAGARTLGPFDAVIATTGFRPDLHMLQEVRLNLDPAVESPAALAPLIDPNLHSCGTVRPHGAEELRHPEPNFYIVGMKSYGRAPTFLMRTGYEQVRSVVAAIAGDWDSARRVELTLPETGVCSGPASMGQSSTCCAPASAPILIAAPEHELIPIMSSQDSSCG